MQDDGERDDCWQRFQAAAAAALEGRWGLARALVERVRERRGAYAAATARAELRAYVQAHERKEAGHG